MSISNLFGPNDSTIYCKNLIANNIDGFPYAGIKGSTRVSINPASNPDPLIGGLLIPAGSGTLTIPITITDIEIGEASPYIYDPKSLFTIMTDTIKIKPGRYSVSFLVNILSYDPMAVQNEGKIVQFMQKDVEPFMGPPVCACSSYNGFPLTTPLVGYNWCIGSSACFSIDVETEFALKIIPNNTTDVTIVLTSGFSIIALD